MGTIRNRMVIVHHWDISELKRIRLDAVKTFQKLVDEEFLYTMDVGAELISPIMVGFCNSEFTFVINGECSKLGWDSSDRYQKARVEWCEKWKDKVCNMLIVDFGEGDQEAFVTEFKCEEEE